MDGNDGSELCQFYPLIIIDFNQEITYVKIVFYQEITPIKIDNNIMVLLRTMERKIARRMEEWKNDPDHKPLVLTGCRQLGKTYSALEFAKTHYQNHIYINFETNPEKKQLFDGFLEYDDLISKLSFSEKVGLLEGGSVIILDGIQDCPNAYSALKTLSLSNEVDVIAISSFLDVNPEDDDGRIPPLGYINMERMHPLDFEEYLWAMGIEKELIETIEGSILNHTPVDEYFNRVLIDHYQRFIVIGGMPEAVRIYSETKDYTRVSKVLEEIVTILREDLDRHSTKSGITKISACMDSIPTQLSREKKEFTYSMIEGKRNVGKKVYGSSLDWLENAGLIYRCHNVSEPVPPLSEKVDEGNFKVYMTDTGILMHLMEDVDPAVVALGDPYIDHGAILENAILSDILKKGYEPFYYSKKNSTLEISFIMSRNNRIGLIDVKSGMNKRAKSLKTMMDQRIDNRDGFKVIIGNVLTEDNGIVHLPLYAFSMIEPREVENIPPALDPEEINRIFRESKGNQGADL